ncbi:MAG TPA: hypothetical protein VIY29_30370, partial [Ktedonobacteraceae bacterium]
EGFVVWQRYWESISCLKLDYLASGSPDCPLIRLYGSVSEDFSQLRQLIERLRMKPRQMILDAVGQ